MRTGHLRRRRHSLSCLLVSQIPHAITGIEETYGEVAEAKAEEVAEATSSTSPEVGADAGAGRGRPRPRFLFSFFLAFGWNLGYIPVAPDSFGATGCPRSRVHKIITSKIQ